MADVANIKLNGTTYNIKDSVARAAMGGPNVAAAKASMTDKTKVYVYTGSESGMTKGNWYYWNGSAWTSGGVYQSTGFVTDKTLTVDGGIADAKVSGDKYIELKKKLTSISALSTYDAKNGAEYESGKVYRADTGVVASWSGFGLYTIDAANALSSITFSGYSESFVSFGYGIYTASGTLLSKGGISNNLTIDIPINADHIYVTIKESDKDAVLLKAIPRIVKVINAPIKTVVVFGDSWSDNNPLHTSYRKWTTHLQETGLYDVRVYAQNGSTITGDQPSYSENGNMQGQYNQFVSDNLDKVDTFFIFGGINDFRAGVTAGNVCLKIESFINNLKANYPRARIIYIANHQIYITHEQLEYFETIVNFVRRVDRIEGYTTFGWIDARNYITDLVHPNNEGYKSLFANILAILNGGAFYYARNVYTPSTSIDGIAFYLYEDWNGGRPSYSAKATVYTAALNQTVTLVVPSSEMQLCASIPVTLRLNKVLAGSVSAEPCCFDNNVLETFTTPNKMNDTNTFIIKTPSNNAGAYRSII